MPAGSKTRSQPPAHGHVFRLSVILGLGGVLAAASALGAAIGSVHHTSMAADCLRILGLVLSYPELNGAEWLLLALAAMGAGALAIAIRACSRQRALYRRFIDQLEVVGQLEGNSAVKVIADPRPQAFCAGYLRPTVYISRPALDLLTDAELQAVLAHENHHRLVRDPLRFACGRVLSQALFFVPALRPLCDRYADVAELSADSAAILASAGQEAPLASALIAFDESCPPGASGISPERVDSLLGQSVRWQLPWRPLVASLGALVTLGVLIWRTSGVASAHASFNLPLLSSRPCLLMLSLLLLACIVLIGRRSNAARNLGEPRRLIG